MACPLFGNMPLPIPMLMYHNIWHKISFNRHWNKVQIFSFGKIHESLRMLISFSIFLLVRNRNVKPATMQGPISICDKTSYCKISWILKAVRFVFRIMQSLGNLTGTLADVLPRCLTTFKVIWWLKLLVSQLWVFTRSFNNTFHRYWNRAQGAVSIRKTVLPGMAIPMLKIRRPNGRLIFNMEIAIRR